MVDVIRDGEQLIAIIIGADHSAEGIEFFTPGNFSQQLAYMKRPAGYLIPPHIHNPVQREVFTTQEALFVRRGRARISFYDDSRRFLESRICGAGDVVFLASGGHGFEMLEETEIVEVKQGPYAGDMDKTRFEPREA